MPQTPPWIQPADPIAATSRGLALGMQMGSEQAAQRFQEQQSMRKEQEDAIAQAQWEAEYGLKAAEVARKHSAMQEYQERIRNGEDPLKVILDVGPSIGMSGAAEAAVIHAQNQRPIPKWSLIPGLPEGVQALQSSAGGIHVIPAMPKPAAQWQDTTKGGIPGQIEVNSGRFQAFPKQADDSFKSMMMADRYAREMDKIRTDAGFLGDISEGGAPREGLSKVMLGQYNAAKTRLKDLQGKINALEGGNAAPAALAPVAPSAAAGIKILNIRPAGQAAPRPAPMMGDPIRAALPGATGPQRPIVPPAWPAQEGMGAPIDAPPMAAPLAPPPAAPTPQPLVGSFQQRNKDTADAANIEGTNRNFIPQMTNAQLEETAHQLGLANAVYDKQDDNFRVWREGQSARQQKKLSRKQFEEALIQLANDKQMAWRGQ